MCLRFLHDSIFLWCMSPVFFCEGLLTSQWKVKSQKVIIWAWSNHLHSSYFIDKVDVSMTKGLI